jgi:hypothetical protein
MDFCANIAGFFGWVGLVVVIVAGALLVLFAAAFAGALAARKMRRAPMPRLTLFLLDIFFAPLKALLPRLTGDVFAVENAGIRLCNRAGMRRYAAVPLAERMVFLPQCLRDSECPATLSSEEGFQCQECGKCLICKIRRAAPDVRVCVSPGGSFSRRLLMRYRPKAALGVACPPDLFEGLEAALRAGVPAQGVALTRVGCVNTDVPFDEVEKALLAGIARSETPQEART